MIEGEPSLTALHVAAARAAHLRYDASPHLLEDSCAEELLGSLADELLPIYADDGPSWLLRENRLFIPFRARYAEDRLAIAYRAGVRQLVILGAGLDSYAFRRPADQSALRVFEVDHPSTQGWKVNRIAELGWQLPAGLHFVPCDFEQTRPSQALRDAGFATDEPAVVTWMGVVYYLEPETVRAALVDLHDMLAPGSEVVFDYQFPVEDLPAHYREFQRQIASYLERVGEPQGNRYRAAELREEILGAGFAEALMEERDALVQRYFAPLDSQIPVSERFGIAVARR